MPWLLDENVKLNRENKRLTSENKELKEKVDRKENDTLILDIVNAFLVENDLINDFDKYLHTHSLEEVYRKEDKIREVWEKL